MVAEMSPSPTLHITLWHPESPGMVVTVRPSWLRRLGIVRSQFATLGEVIRMYRGRHA